MALAKTHISITDDSAFAEGIDTLIPLYVFATAQDKVLDETTGEIAIGTTKSLAGELSVVTSRKDVTEKFGTPLFEELNGTIQQNSELNEVGLYGLYDAMGATSLAYAIRADIDLDQLQAREEEPKGLVKNGTRWLDLSKSKFGLFIHNGDTKSMKSKQWDEVQYEIIANGNVEGISEGTYVINFIGNDFEIGEVKEGAYVKVTELIVDSSMVYPTATEGTIWVRTTPVNGGAEIIVKQFVSSTGRWVETTVPMGKDVASAIAQLGEGISSGSLAFVYNAENSKFELKTPKELTKDLSVSEKNSVLENVEKITIKSSTKGVVKSLVHVCKGMTVEVAKTITSELKTHGKKGLRLTITDGGLKLEGEATFVQLAVNTKTPVEGSEEGTFEVETFVVGDSVEFVPFVSELKIGFNEPSQDAEEGTLWFNDDIKVDIMVNDGMGKWVGFNNAKESVNANIYVTSEEPINERANYSLWIDTNNPNFPSIYRLYEGEWVLLDNTDQTTPDGVLFADARYYIEKNKEYIDPIKTKNEDDRYHVEDGKIMGCLLKSDHVDPDCPNPLAYPGGMILFNTRFSTNNVKEFKKDPFVGLYDKDTGEYTVGNDVFTLGETKRWISASGNAENGAGLFGKQAQRKMVVNALASAIVSNEDIRSMDYDFFFATCPGYPELDNELLNLNTDKKEMFYIVSDTPKTLEPDGKKIQDWATNANNTVSHGLEGRVLMNEYMTRQFPPMGLASNVDGSEIAVPTSVVKMKNLLVLPRGQICAGTQYGQITNVGSVGYITEENEYSPVVVADGLGEVCCTHNINPLMPRRGTGLLIWGERTENSVDSSLSDEHAIITLLRLKRELESAVQPFFFRINNESIRTEFHNVLNSVLTNYVGTGEIYDFALETGDSVNTPDRINRRELWANISLEISKGIEQIYLPIKVVATGSL